jgi:hypothetical protein
MIWLSILASQRQPVLFAQPVNGKMKMVIFEKVPSRLLHPRPISTDTIVAIFQCLATKITRHLQRLHLDRDLTTHPTSFIRALLLLLLLLPLLLTLPSVFLIFPSCPLLLSLPPFLDVRFASGLRCTLTKKAGPTRALPSRSRRLLHQARRVRFRHGNTCKSSPQ